MTIEQWWWVLMMGNVGLALFLIYRNTTMKKKYEALEDDLHRQYKMVESDALDKGMKYMDALE